jgi:membrane protease YdiL (CAAX protease family)
MGWLLGYPLWVASGALHSAVLRVPRLRGLLTEALVSLPCALALYFLVACIVLLWQSFFVEHAFPEAAAETVSRLPSLHTQLGFLALACTLGPLAEEVFFRGFLYNALRRWCPTALAAILQAILFGAYHQGGLAFVVLTSVVGLFLVVLYEWRKTLLAPLFVHVIYNCSVSGVALAAILASHNAPRLGVFGEAHESGLMITEVVPGSTAEESGLRPGDVIITFEGEPVPDIDALRAQVRSRRVGENVRIHVLRDQQHITIELTLRKPSD